MIRGGSDRQFLPDFSTLSHDWAYRKVEHSMILSEEDFREIARLAEISFVGARKLCGGLKIEFAKVSQSDLHLETKSFEVGLRILDDAGGISCMTGLPKQTAIENIARILKKYRNSCPQVINWVCSGRFNQKKPEKSVKFGELRHAMITVGRLRALLVRSTVETKKPLGEVESEVEFD